MGKRETMYLEEVADRDICVLRVKGELDFDQRKDFSERVEELLAVSQKRLVVDLTGTRRLFSVFLGSMVDVHQRAEAAGKTLTVLASERVGHLFEQANLTSVLNVVVVGSE